MALTNMTCTLMANTTYELIRCINTDVTGGYFGILMIVALFVIVLLNMAYHDAENMFVIASFFVTVVSALGWISGLVPLYVWIVSLVMFVVFIILNLHHKK